MMVPRAFLFSSVSPVPTTKKNALPRLASKPEQGLRLPEISHLEDLGLVDATASHPHTNPVVIPPKRGPRMTSVQQSTVGRNEPKTPRGTLRRSPSTATARSDRSLPTSVASILEATAIPVPRRNRSIRETRRLPRGNHVEDFSKLLMEGVKSRDDCLMEGSPLDILLSPPEEETEKMAMAMSNDVASDSPFSLRSVSTESMPSLVHDIDSPESLPLLSSPSSQRSPLDRKYRILSLSEDCALDHPLLEDEELLDLEPTMMDEGDEIPPLPSPSPSSSSLADPGSTAKSSRPFRSLPRFTLPFKSNLTASLRALKSAAQSVSTFATPSVQPDNFLTQSLFTITPGLTDDRRPLPMQEPPSPALRRYLNPMTVSPAEMHVYHDHRHELAHPAAHRPCPVSIQMQTYHRSDTEPVPPPITRQREPRENCDFLRMVVLEMNMRRHGKLRDDIPMRARIWLPPRKGIACRLPNCHSAVPSRWIGVSVECM